MPFFPAQCQADTQIPLIEWDTGSQHVNREEGKQQTVGAQARFICHEMFVCFLRIFIMSHVALRKEMN